MTRIFLAAGVAALAIAAPATAGPGGHAKGDRTTVQKNGGGKRAAAVQQRRAGGGAAVRAQRVQRAAAPRVQRQQIRTAKVERSQRQQIRAARIDRPHPVAAVERKQQRAVHAQAANRQQLRAERKQQVRANRLQQANRQQRTQMVQNRAFERQQLRANRIQQVQNRALARQEFRANRIDRRMANAGTIGYGVGGCPPGLVSKGCMPPGQALKADRIANAQAFRASRLAAMTVNRTRILAPAQAMGLLGVPLTTAATMAAFSPLPQTVQYLYPDTPNYYYRYGDGYLYQVDRGTSLISALLPLLGGGYLPGQYLPASYMNSYVPNNYGFNSFYPDSPYDCNRYANGVVYEVDCVTGLVEDVIPLYASGYGVGQMLPSAYSYYNVPTQYRSMYYDTPNTGYWYAPGAIYQYDPRSSMITSVASLLSPGFTVGQPLPMGYDVYNVPYAYRQTYYDTPNAWYRYNNGNIYQVDPMTQLVTAVVASILT